MKAKKEYSQKSTFTMFAKDWGKYVKDNHIQVMSSEHSYNDVKIVHPGNMPLKECRYLNKLLGINRLNYHGNPNLNLKRWKK